MADQPALKRPKLEDDDSHSVHQHHRPSANGAAAPTPVASSVAADEEAMAEEAILVLALVAHRERDVERCKFKLLHYQSYAFGLSPFLSFVSPPFRDDD
ncbi:unnamed protein product [Urochloa humidicola]